MTGAPNTSLGWKFVAPALALLVALNVYPLLSNIVLSFTNAELSGGGWGWVGFANFKAVFTEPRYLAALNTTAVFTAIAVGVELLLGFLAALALHRSFTGRSVLLIALLVPMMLSPAVMGMFWNLILNGSYGVLNQTLAVLGLHQPQWLTDPAWKLTAVLLVDIWMWTPFTLLVSLAGLQSIPPALNEAAEIDRLSAFQTFRRVTLPLVAPFLFLAALFRATDALKQFDLVMALTGPNDGATQTLSALLYQTIFGNGRIGLGSAFACVALIGVIVLTTIVVKTLDRIQRNQGRTA